METYGKHPKDYRGQSLLGISGLLLFFVSLQKEFANAKKTAFCYPMC
jgi:hypothetical protein